MINDVKGFKDKDKTGQDKTRQDKTRRDKARSKAIKILEKTQGEKGRRAEIQIDIDIQTTDKEADTNRTKARQDNHITSQKARQIERDKRQKGTLKRENKTSRKHVRRQRRTRTKARTKNRTRIPTNTKITHKT